MNNNQCFKFDQLKTYSKNMFPPHQYSILLPQCGIGLFIIKDDDYQLIVQQFNEIMNEIDKLNIQIKFYVIQLNKNQQIQQVDLRISKLFILNQQNNLSVQVINDAQTINQRFYEILLGFIQNQYNLKINHLLQKQIQQDENLTDMYKVVQRLIIVYEYFDQNDFNQQCLTIIDQIINILLKQTKDNKISLYPQFLIDNYTTEQLLGIYVQQQNNSKDKPRRHQQRLVSYQSFQYINLEQEKGHSRYISNVEQILDSQESIKQQTIKQTQEIDIPEWIIMKTQIEDLFGQLLNNNCQNVQTEFYNVINETLLWLINILISYTKDQENVVKILLYLKQIYTDDIYEYLVHRIIYVFSQKDIVLCGDLINIYLQIQNNIQITNEQIHELQQIIYNKISQIYKDDEQNDEQWIQYVSQQQILLVNILPQLQLTKEERILFNNILAKKDEINIFQQLEQYIKENNNSNQFLSLSLYSSYTQQNEQLHNIIEQIVIKDFKSLIDDTFKSQIRQDLIKKFYQLYPQLSDILDKYQKLKQIEQNTFLELYDVDKLLINKNYFQISQIQDIQTLIIPDEILQLIQYDTIKVELIDMYSNKLSVEKQVKQQQNTINYRLKVQSQQNQDLYFLLFKVTLISSENKQSFDILNIKDPQFILKQVIQGVEGQITKQNDLVFSQVENLVNKPNYIINFSSKRPQFQIQYLNNQQNTYYQYSLLNLCFYMKFQFRSNNEIKISVSKNCKINNIKLLYIDDSNDSVYQKTLATLTAVLPQDVKNYISTDIEQNKFVQLQGRSFYFIISAETTYDDITIDFTIKNQENQSTKQFILKGQPLLDIQYKIVNNRIILQYDLSNNKSSYTIQQAKIFLNDQIINYDNEFQLIKEKINQKKQKIQISYVFMNNSFGQQLKEEIRSALEQVIVYAQIEVYQDLICNEYKQLINTELKNFVLYTIQFQVSNIKDDQIIKLQSQQFVLSKLIKQEQTKDDEYLLTYEIIYLKPGYYIYPKLQQSSINLLGCREQKPVFVKVIE